jgi:hypothetical protein
LRWIPPLAAYFDVQVLFFVFVRTHIRFLTVVNRLAARHFSSSKGPSWRAFLHGDMQAAVWFDAINDFDFLF